MNFAFIFINHNDLDLVLLAAVAMITPFLLTAGVLALLNWIDGGRE